MKDFQWSSNQLQQMKAVISLGSQVVLLHLEALECAYEEEGQTVMESA